MTFINKQQICFPDRKTSRSSDDENGDFENDYSAIEDARCEHDVLCHVTQLANDVFAPLIGISLCGAIIQICLALVMVSGLVEDTSPSVIYSLCVNIVASVLFADHSDRRSHCQ